MGLKSIYFRIREVLFINRLSHIIPGMVKPFILCYHQIDSKEFDAQLSALKKRFEVVDLKTFSERIKNKQKGAYCAITLDDCLREDMTKTTQVCIRHNVPITFFVPVRFSKNHQALPGTWLQKFFEQRNEFLLNGKEISVTPQNRAQIKAELNTVFNPVKLRIEDFDKKVQELFLENNLQENDIISDEYKIITYDEIQQYNKESIFSFQSHTYNHQSLGLCTADEIEDEFSVSKKALEELTGDAMFAICYPYGSKEVIGDKIFGFVGKYYTCGLSLVQGVCDSKTDIYFMPRIGIYPGDGLNGFWGKIYHHMQKSYSR